MSQTLTIPEKTVLALEVYDVVVCGAGPAGCAAAVSSARQGLKTLVLEAQGQLGGMGTSGLVSQWLGGRRPDGTWVVGGFFREISRQATEEGIAHLPTLAPGQKYTPYGWHPSLVEGVPFDPFAMAAFLDRKLIEERVTILLHTRVVDIQRQGKRITHVILSNKGGIQAVPARAVIDATGDADVAVYAGCATDKGREGDGAMTPVTLEVHVYNVDQSRVSDYVQENDEPRFRNLIKALRHRGEWPLSVDAFICSQLTEPGTMMLNTTRLCNCDGTDGASITHAMIEGRAEIEKLLRCLRKYFPGFAGARIKAVAPLLGVRETRRIHAKQRLTVEDLVSGITCPDAVGWSSYGWDLPDPKRPSYQPCEGKAKPDVIPIPYGIMVPLAVDNLVCPGRAVSVDRDVLGPLRVMAPVMAMGEAAGAASAQVVNQGTPFEDVDVEVLQAVLRRSGAIIEQEVSK